MGQAPGLRCNIHCHPVHIEAVWYSEWHCSNGFLGRSPFDYIQDYTYVAVILYAQEHLSNKAYLFLRRYDKYRSAPKRRKIRRTDGEYIPLLDFAPLIITSKWAQIDILTYPLYIQFYDKIRDLGDQNIIIQQCTLIQKLQKVRTWRSPCHLVQLQSFNRCVKR